MLDGPCGQASLEALGAMAVGDRSGFPPAGTCARNTRKGQSGQARKPGASERFRQKAERGHDRGRNCRQDAPSPPLAAAMRYSLVIFDFDGTLADSFTFFVKAQHALAQRHGFNAIAEDRVDEMRRLGTRELLQEIGFPKWKLPIVAADFVRTMRDAPPMPLFPGIPDMLHHLRDGNVRLAILTSNSTDNVRRALGSELMDTLELVDGGVHMLGKHRRIARMLKQARVDASQAIYVGDHVSDGEAALRAGVAFGAVGWGYAHASALRAAGAQHLFDSVDELRLLAGS